MLTKVALKQMCCPVMVLVQQFGSIVVAMPRLSVQSLSVAQPRSMPVPWMSIDGTHDGPAAHATPCTAKLLVVTQQAWPLLQSAGTLQLATNPPSGQEDEQAGVVPITQHDWPGPHDELPQTKPPELAMAMSPTEAPPPPPLPPLLPPLPPLPPLPVCAMSVVVVVEGVLLPQLLNAIEVNRSTSLFIRRSSLWLS